MDCERFEFQARELETVFEDCELRLGSVMPDPTAVFGRVPRRKLFRNERIEALHRYLEMQRYENKSRLLREKREKQRLEKAGLVVRQPTRQGLHKYPSLDSGLDFDETSESDCWQGCCVIS